jgi:hypothetical protein
MGQRILALGRVMCRAANGELFMMEVRCVVTGRGCVVTGRGCVCVWGGGYVCTHKVMVHVHEQHTDNPFPPLVHAVTQSLGPSILEPD